MIILQTMGMWDGKLDICGESKNNKNFKYILETDEIDIKLKLNQSKSVGTFYLVITSNEEEMEKIYSCYQQEIDKELSEVIK